MCSLFISDAKVVFLISFYNPAVNERSYKFMTVTQIKH